MLQHYINRNYQKLLFLRSVRVKVSIWYVHLWNWLNIKKMRTKLSYIIMVPFLKHWIDFTSQYHRINQRGFGAMHMRKMCMYVQMLYVHAPRGARAKYIFSRRFDFSQRFERVVYLSKQHRTRDCYAYHIPNEQLLYWESIRWRCIVSRSTLYDGIYCLVYTSLC